MSLAVMIVGAVIAVLFYFADVGVGAELIRQYPQALEYYPAFIATAMGVLLALLLEEALSLSKQEKRIEGMKDILKKEIERMHALVAQRKGNYLNTQVWDSLVNSGDVSSLQTDLLGDLFEVYEKAKSLNIETSRLRDAAEAHRRMPSEDTKAAHTQLSIQIDEKELQLQNAIGKFLKSKKL